jgi:hypothetical protein
VCAIGIAAGFDSYGGVSRQRFRRRADELGIKLTLWTALISIAGAEKQSDRMIFGKTRVRGA